MTQLDLDQIEARRAAASKGPWSLAYEYCDCSEDCGHGLYVSRINTGSGPATELCDLPRGDWELMVHAREDGDAMAAAIRRLRANAAAELLPAWEAVYEPGNVSDYLIGYTNDECAAKAAAEAWLRSQADVTGRLEWEPWGTATAMPDGYDAWFELVEHHDDGIPTGPGLIVRRRAAAEETHVVADDSDDPEHIDDCPGCDVSATARTAAFREAADIAESLRQFAPAFGARKAAQVSENVGILRVAKRLRRIADEAEYVATPCDPMVPCEDGGEPCHTHERLMGHAEGDHELCGDECTADRCTCDSEDHTHDGGCPLYPAAASAAARP